MSYRVLMVLLLVAGGAAAHRVNLLVLPDGDTLQGHVYYANGTTVAGVKVDVQDTNGETVDTITTDANGRFSYTPQSQADLVFVVATDDGHRAEGAYSHSELAASTPSTHAASEHEMDQAQIQRIVQHELLPLREQLDRYQGEIRVRDILGGIGYIVGMLGIVAWIKSRRPGRMA